MPLDTAPDAERQAGSVWSMCMGLLAQGALSLPASELGRPLGADDAFLRSFDLYDVDSVAALVGNLTRQAASHSPFIWHRARRHVPTPSGVCAKPAPQAFGTQSRLHVGAVRFLADQEYEVRPDEGASFPLHGFSWGMLGYGNCVCGSLETATTCRLSDEACAGAPAGCLAALCQERRYALSDARAVWECLHASGSGVRCPELGPSDSWGLFPMDCSTQECLSARAWVGNARQDVTFEGIRFFTESRSGLKLPNYKHVNATFHEAVHYGAQDRPPADYRRPVCADVLSEDRGLFPALQVLFDSPVVSHCARFIVETARLEALPPDDIQDASQQAALWKGKCAAKIRHLSSCHGTCPLLAAFAAA